MDGWIESRIDRQIREAQERGEFDDLPGAGKPLPGHNQPYDENWWVKGLMRRENLTFVGPPLLALRKEIEELPRRLARERTENSVRLHVADLNDRIVTARNAPSDGPRITVDTVDVEEVVRTWRASRQG